MFKAFMDGYRASGAPGPHVVIATVLGYMTKAGLQSVAVVLALRLMGVL